MIHRFVPVHALWIQTVLSARSCRNSEVINTRLRHRAPLW